MCPQSRFATAFAIYPFANSQFADYPRPDGTVKMANLPVPSVSDRQDSQTAAETRRGRRDAKEKKQKCIDVNDVKAKQTMICNAVRYVSFQVPGRQRV